MGRVCFRSCVGWCHSWMVTFFSSGFFFLCFLLSGLAFYQDRDAAFRTLCYLHFFFAAFLRLQTLVLDFPRLLESLYDTYDFFSSTFALRTLLLELDLPSTLDGSLPYLTRSHLLAHYSRSLTAIRSFLYPKVYVLRAPVLYVIPSLTIL